MAQQAQQSNASKRRPQTGRPLLDKARSEILPKLKDANANKSEEEEALVVSALDRAIFRDTNRLRTDPKSFLPYLEARLSHFRENTVWTPGVKVGEITKEGPAAVQEAIDFIKTMKPVAKLRWSKEMAMACRDHVVDVGPKGATGHNNTDGTTTWQRLERYG